ncbi:MAG TPA: flagellar basal body rod C-terminal domain-containing protein [Bryobacteraceae bacterium]|jgi:flagellar hook protein FlgE
MSVSGIALNGLNQAQATLENAAKRISGSAGRGDSVDLSTDAVDLIQAKSDFEANIRVLKVADEMNKSAIDLVA